MLSIDIIRTFRGKTIARVCDECDIAVSTYYNIRHASENISHTVLSKLDNCLLTGGSIHIMFLLDRLFRCGVRLHPDHVSWGPADPIITEQLISKHPVFNNSNIMESR